MCIARKHLDFLDERNERDYKAGDIGYETYVRFADHVHQCRQCDLLDNGRQGDIYDECRVRILRYFISAKRDDMRRLVQLMGVRPPDDETGTDGEG
jgi:hypothetical protein